MHLVFFGKSGVTNTAVITDDIRNLAMGPLFTVTRYEGMDING
jgi:hypothetical protein